MTSEGYSIDDPSNLLYVALYRPGYANVTSSSVSTKKVYQEFSLDLTVETDIYLLNSYGFTFVLHLPTYVEFVTTPPSNCSDWTNISSTSTCTYDSSLKTITV